MKEKMGFNRKLWLGAVVLALFALAMPVSAMSVDSGESWISWSWNLNEGQEVNIYVNGIEIASNSTSEYYLMSGMEPGEKAHIELYNSTSGDLLVSNTASTTTPMYVVMVFLILMVVLVIISYVVEYEISLIIGAFNLLMGIMLVYLSMGISMMVYVAGGILAVQAMVMGIQIYANISDALEWF